MVIRLGKGEKRLDARETRKHWFNLTGAKQIRMEFVKEPKDLAAYLSDQRKKKNMGGEFAWQDMMIRWRWSKGWLPQGFTKAFGRFWLAWIDEKPIIREMVLSAWLQRCLNDPSQVEHWPRWTDFPAEADIFQSVFQGLV